MNAFAQAGDITNLLKFYRKLKKEGLKPDLKLYTVIISGISKKGLFF